jgi:hypothetical protein
MSERPPEGEEGTGCAGCLIVIGLIIVAVSLGIILGTYGWLLAGVVLVLLGILAAVRRR